MRCLAKEPARTPVRDCPRTPTDRGGDPQLAWGSSTPPSEERTRSIPNNLPRQSTSFIGRREQLREVQELIRAKRMVTLTGRGDAARPDWRSKSRERSWGSSVMASG